MITANEMIRMLQEAIEKSGDKNMPVFVRPSNVVEGSGGSELSAEIQFGERVYCDNEWDDRTRTVPCIVFNAEDLNNTVVANGTYV